MSLVIMKQLLVQKQWKILWRLLLLVQLYPLLMHKSIHTFWNVYEFGISGQKPTKNLHQWKETE